MINVICYTDMKKLRIGTMIPVMYNSLEMVICSIFNKDKRNLIITNPLLFKLKKRREKALF